MQLYAIGVNVEVETQPEKKDNSSAGIIISSKGT